MDSSCNNIDLKYLLNPAFAPLFDEKKPTANQLSREELEFYKRRIFLLTKKFLKGEKTNDKSINNIFEKYASQCIEYFKFNDKKEIIQNDYKNLSMNQGKDTPLVSEKEANTIIMKKPHQKIPKITDHIDIKTTRPNKKIVIPKVRNINLKDKKFRKKKNNT